VNCVVHFVETVLLPVWKVIIISEEMLILRAPKLVLELGTGISFVLLMCIREGASSSLWLECGNHPVSTAPVTEAGITVSTTFGQSAIDLSLTSSLPTWF